MGRERQRSMLRTRKLYYGAAGALNEAHKIHSAYSNPRP